MTGRLPLEKTPEEAKATRGWSTWGATLLPLSSAEPLPKPYGGSSSPSDKGCGPTHT